MDDIIQISDEVRCGETIGRVIHINRHRGIYMVRSPAGDTMHYRHEIEPMKWVPADIANTGIGVCAKNGSQEFP